MKDWTPLGHVVVAISFQMFFFLVLGDAVFGTGLAIGWFWSREHTQREASIWPRGSYKPSEWWRGFTGWSKDRWLDAIFPTIAVMVVYLFIE